MCRLALPSSITSITSSGHVTKRSVAPFTKVHRFLSSWTDRLTFETVKKAKIIMDFYDPWSDQDHYRIVVKLHMYTYHQGGHGFCPYKSQNKKPVIGVS